LKKDYKIASVPLSSVEERVAITQELLKNKEIDVILNGVWIFKDVAASPHLYFKKEFKISNLKISSGTKRIDLVKPYFDY
jgi:hypothetical protein